MLSLHLFLFINTDLGTIKQSKMHKNYDILLRKITLGSYLFNTSNNYNNSKNLASYAKRNILLLASNTMYVKNKIEDDVLCKNAGQSKLRTTYLHNTHS